VGEEWRWCEILLYWTLETRKFLLLKREKKRKKKKLGDVSPPRHLDAVVISCLPFIVEFSNIINNEI